MTRYVGIDLAKRSMEVCILEGCKIERHKVAMAESAFSASYNMARLQSIIWTVVLV
jgi:hypothetical protein